LVEGAAALLDKVGELPNFYPFASELPVASYSITYYSTVASSLGGRGPLLFYFGGARPPLILLWGGSRPLCPPCSAAPDTARNVWHKIWPLYSKTNL